MAYRAYCAVSGVLFSIVALMHLVRVVYDMPVTVDAYDLPMIVSWLGFAIPAALAFWAFRTMRS
jgi:hypothetical protein